MQQIITNSTVDGILSVLFAVLIVVVDAVRVWIGIIGGRKQPAIQEAPWEESHLDVDGNEVGEPEPVGAGSVSRSDE